MSEHQEIWVSQAHWRENWVVVRKLRGGGQGNAWRVRRKLENRDGFLKAIKAKRDRERRARFSREANAYGTVTARGIPRLIESNAHRWDEVEAEPYIVTDFIEGPTLRQWRENRERVEPDEAIDATRELLAILSKCHEAGLVHRDVKPDNIILADDDPGRPILLDFGLSFRKGSDIDFETEHGQEVGNRFSAGSAPGSLLRALALVDGRGIGRHQGVQPAEAVHQIASLEPCGKLAGLGVNVGDKAEVAVVNLLVVVVLDLHHLVAGRGSIRSARPSVRRPGSGQPGARC